jgi:pyrroline-5-carboxylate reductase
MKQQERIMSGFGKYGFIGGGNMGGALIKGLIQSGLAVPSDIYVFEPDQQTAQELADQYRVNLISNNQDLLKQAGVIVLAVKPQVMDQVLGEIGQGLTEKHLLISVAAGVSLGHIQSVLSASVPLIRAMPNTPALVLGGASVLSPGAFATRDHMAKALAVFGAVGLAVEMDEKYLDVVTGLSGSGPAYVFVLLEALADGAVRMGLPRREAQLLSAQTVMGAAKLALESDLHTGQLKDMVTSPGGTTIAGLQALENGGFRGVVMEAVAAATKRARELGGK